MRMNRYSDAPSEMRPFVSLGGPSLRRSLPWTLFGVTRSIKQLMTKRQEDDECS